jgi:adenine-specific DNA-methyltransferase
MINKQILFTVSDAIKHFTEIDSGKLDLKEASIKLLQTLGYSSDNTTSLSSPDTKGFDKFAKLSTSYQSFNKTIALFDQWQEVHFLFQLTDDDIRYTNQISLFKPEFKNDLYDSYLFFAIDLGSESKAKYKLANITREINKLFPMPVLVIYKTGDLLSIAIINRRYNKIDQDKHVLGKVTTIKDISVINPHRAHIEILAEMSLQGLIESGYEVSSFLSLHKAWSYVLNTESLNKRFYNNIREWFSNARKTVRFPIKGDDSDVSRTENLIRLLTRMIFVWFIKEKHLVDDKLFDIDYLKREILNPNCTEHSQYYKAILQNLFFATLNNEMNKDNPEFQRQFMPDKRNFKQGHLNQYYYRYLRMFQDENKALELFELTPFLNGGLFECLDDPKTKERKDYFTNPLENRDLIFVPDELFFAEDNKGNPKGLINIFKHYKFTVSENTPIEEEIALDPELLGKVFESLLSEWDSEFNESKKKHTGSYYTPRDIVDYMVTKALISYLDNYAIDHNSLLVE